MKFASILTIITSACLASAKPIQKRELGGVLICTGANATGTCDYQVYEMDACYNLTAPLYQNAATFAPDGEEFYCNPFGTLCGVGICTSPEGCTLGAVTFNYAHKYNLGDVSWDKSIASFRCHAGKSPTGY